jgi:hypothetical protein
MCLALALAWRAQIEQLACWREAFEEDFGPAAGECRPS